MKKLILALAVVSFTLTTAQETPKKACCSDKEKKECTMDKDKKASNDKKSKKGEKKACCTSKKAA